MYIMEQSTASRTVSGVGLSAEHGSDLLIWNHDRFLLSPHMVYWKSNWDSA
jgi:hypothetical protein